MTSRFRTFLGILAVAALVAACGNASATPSAAPVQSAAGSQASTAFPSSTASVGVAATGTSTAAPGASKSPGAAGSAASGSPSASASPASRCLSIGLSHVDPVLEAYLPCTIGGIDLERFSVSLSEYIGSSTGGDRSLYGPWLVGFALTPEEVHLAVVADLTAQENFVVHAIGVAGVDDAKLSASFADQAKKAGWTVAPKTVAGHALLEMTDPEAKKTGGLAVGYVFAKNHVLYTIITDDPALLVEALIKLP